MPYGLFAWLLACPVGIKADQAQYFCDELGRLVGKAGNVAVYNLGSR